MAIAGTFICACAVCREDMVEGDKLTQHIVYDFEGDVDYIELAHAACGERDNVKRPNYWEP